MRDDRVYLRYIAECIDRIRDYLADAEGAFDERAFLQDGRTQDAVLRRLETLADAATHLSSGLKTRYTDIPWRRINDFRNVLAHGYTETDLNLVWRTIVTDLPALRAIIDQEMGGS